MASYDFGTLTNPTDRDSSKITLSYAWRFAVIDGHKNKSNNEPDEPLRFNPSINHIH